MTTELMWVGAEGFAAVFTGRSGGGSFQFRWIDIFLQSRFPYEVKLN